MTIAVPKLSKTQINTDYQVLNNLYQKFEYWGMWGNCGEKFPKKLWNGTTHRDFHK